MRVTYTLVVVIDPRFAGEFEELLREQGLSDLDRLTLDSRLERVFVWRRDFVVPPSMRGEV